MKEHIYYIYLVICDCDVYYHAWKRKMNGLLFYRCILCKKSLEWADLKFVGSIKAKTKFEAIETIVAKALGKGE